MTEQGKCKDCRFFQENSEHDPGIGLCRRYPPTYPLRLLLPSANKGDFGEWPTVTHEDWCGEFRAKQAVATNGQAVLSVGGLPIGRVDLSFRARKGLKRLGITSVEQLAQYRPEDLLDVKNMGMVTLNEIKRFLARHGLSLRSD